MQALHLMAVFRSQVEQDQGPGPAVELNPKPGTKTLEMRAEILHQNQDLLVMLTHGKNLLRIPQLLKCKEQIQRTW